MSVVRMPWVLRPFTEYSARSTRLPQPRSCTDQQFAVGHDHFQPDNQVVVEQPHRHHAAGRASHRPHRAFGKARRLAVARDDQKILLAAGQLGKVKRVAFVQVHGNQPDGADVGKRAGFHPFDATVARQQRDEIRGLEVRHDQHAGHRSRRAGS
jgi:hypothetical protein